MTLNTRACDASGTCPATGALQFSWRAHADTVFDLEFSRDGTQLVTAGADRLIRVWDAGSRKELAVLEGHTATVR